MFLTFRFYFLIENIVTKAESRLTCARPRPKPQNFSETKTEITKFLQNQDWDRSRSLFCLPDRNRQSSRPRLEKWRHQWFFKNFLRKKILGLIFAHKLVLWVYKLIQMTNCFSQIFIYIISKIIFEDCLQLNVVLFTERSKPDHLFFLRNYVSIKLTRT